MKYFLGVCVLALVAAMGCSEATTVEPIDPNTAAIGLIETEISQELLNNNNRNFIGILSGREEVPPRDTHGRGVAKFQVSRDGSSIHYKLIVANIYNVVAAHIHRGGVGLNGPVVIGLYSAAAGGGRIQGPIAEGDFTPADLGGPMAGSTTFEMFLESLHSDSLYVNVHTDDGIAPPNTGAGDFPGGEIRGQLKGHVASPNNLN